MNTTLTIQKVNGLIRRSGVWASTKLPSSSKHYRTPGVYANKVGYDTVRILIGFDSWGYDHNKEKGQRELKAFMDFAESEGYTFTLTPNGREYEING